MKINFSKPIKSPHEDYKGTITFPYPFVAATYRKWSDSHREYITKESNGKVVTGSYQSNGDGQTYPQIDPAKWGTLLDLCEVKIKGLPDGWDKDDSGESIPFKVMAWAVELVDIYENENLNLKAPT